MNGERFGVRADAITVSTSTLVGGAFLPVAGLCAVVSGRPGQAWGVGTVTIVGLTASMLHDRRRATRSAAQARLPTHREQERIEP